MNIFARRHCLQTLLAGLWLVCASALGAEGEVTFDVSSPAVKAIRKSLVDRHVILREFFDTGAIGFTHEGLIAVRDTGPLARDRRAMIDALVAEDNKDRSTLYREIARANGRPDWESPMQNAFAERWISRAPVGWYYRDSGGQWVRKRSHATGDDAAAKASGPPPVPGS